MKKVLVKLLCLAVSFLSLIILAPPLYAQTDSGTVRGTVTDQTGAVLPGAAITLTSKDTGQVRTSKSDSRGEFNFESLLRGRYTARVQAQGFSIVEQSFELRVSQTLSIPFTLSPGAVADTINVTDSAPVVDTSTSSTGMVIEGDQITDLPLNGRNFTKLAMLTPGVTRGTYGSAASGAAGNSETFRYNETGGAALSANGLRQQANNFELDGIDNNELLVGTIVFFPPVEATQEFRISTTVSSAEYGGAGGAMIQSSIKSGSNQFHGSAFLFDRDQIFDANPNYNFEGTPSPIPVFHRTQFGGTLGGPIVRNRLFLFGDYQGLRQKQPQGQSFLTVPTAKMRTGDFSEFLNPNLTQGNSIPGTVNSFWIPACNNLGGNSANTFGVIVNPLTCTPFNYNGQPNVINPAQMSQAGLKYLKAYPLPTPALAAKTVVNNYQVNPSQTQSYDDFDVRLDANITRSDTAFVRYSYGQDILKIASQLPNLPAGFGAGYNPTHPRGLAAGYTHIFSPSLVNELRFGYTRPYYAYINPFNNVPLASELGIPGSNTSMEGGLGIINSGFSGSGDAGPYEVPQKTIQFADSISWTRKNHTFKAGADIMYHQVKYFQIPDAKGQWNFGNNFTGYSGADLLAGFVNDFEAGVGVPQGFIDTRNWQTGYFVQDDWKVNRRLTLNLGVRYDFITHPVEAHDNQSNFDLKTLTLREAGKNGNSRALVNNNYDNFGPRIGFAYDLTGNGKTSIRGGYGIFYFMERGGGGNGLFSNADFNGTQETDGWRGSQNRINLSGMTPGCSTTVTSNCQSSNYDNNAADATGPLPFPTIGTLVDAKNPTGVRLISQDPHSPTSMVQEWNLQIQRQIDHATSVTVAYVGTKSDHLMTPFNLNTQEIGYVNGQHAAYNQALYPAFGTIDRIVNEGMANDNAFEVTLQRNMYKGLQLTGAYTWAHALDDSNGAFDTGTNSAGNRIEVMNGAVNLKGKYGNYGNSDQDIRHSFTFSALADLPFGRGKAFGGHLPAPVEYVVGGWQLNTIVTLQSGSPFDATTGKATISDGSVVWAVPNERTDLTGRIKYKKSVKEWFDYTQFTPPPATWVNGVNNGYPVFDRQGTVGRNALYGPSFRTLDASLFKNIPIRENVTGQFRVQAYNLTNTPEFTNPNGQISPGYNTYTSSQLDSKGIPLTDTGNAAQINGVRLHSERQLEFAFRLTF